MGGDALMHSITRQKYSALLADLIRARSGGDYDRVERAVDKTTDLGASGNDEDDEDKPYD